jgi:hypothetical protein
MVVLIDCVDGRMNRFMDRRMNKWMNGCMDRWMDMGLGAMLLPFSHFWGYLPFPVFFKALGLLLFEWTDG